MRRSLTTPNKTTPKSIASLVSLSAFVKGVCDVMRRSNCASALQYVPELTWILFLRILDAQETREHAAAEALGRGFTPALRPPYRWQDWAAPYGDAEDHPRTIDGRPQGWKRRELFALGDGHLIGFANKALLPYLHGLDLAADGRPNPAASRKRRIVGRIMTAVERARVDSETNLAEILDRVHRLSIDHIEDTHFFTLSQVYEDLLLKMGEKNSDGGQFFTPREGGRCAIVLDEGLLFRTNERAFVETKRRLLDECDLWCVVSLPGGVFSTAGAGVKTNLLFFTKGRPTERTWYYDLSGVRVGKKQPLTLAHFGFGRDGAPLDDGGLPAFLVQLLGEPAAESDGEPGSFPSFARLLPIRGTPGADGPLSWTWT